MRCWRIHLWQDVLAAWDGLPKDYTAAARTMGANGFQTACYVTAPLLKPALRRGLTLASATCIGEICGHIIPVAPRMADADHFDLRLSRTRRCGQLRTGDGVDGGIDRFGFNGIFAGGRSGRTKGRLNVVGSNSLHIHHTIAAPCIEN